MKRMISVILVLALTVSAFSFTIQAETEPQEELSNNWFTILQSDYPLTSWKNEKDIENFGSYNRWWWKYWNRYSGQLKRHDWIIGDVNLDGKVNVSDALFTLKYAVDEDGIMLPTPQAIETRMGRFIRLGAYTWSYRQMALISRRWGPPCWDYMWSVTCLCNSRLMSDVSGNCSIDASDALAILQYALGKRTAFERTDFSGNDTVFFVPYVADWEPGAIKMLSQYEGIIESDYYPVDESLIPDWDTYAGDDKDFFIY